MSTAFGSELSQVLVYNRSHQAMPFSKNKNWKRTFSKNIHNRIEITLRYIIKSQICIMKRLD